MDHPTDYSEWSNADLIDRVTKLEEELRKSGSQYEASRSFYCISLLPEQAGKKTTKPKKEFDSSRYNTRYIAIKFAYLGQRYNGYEHHANNTTPLPTIEEELWKALVKTKLIFPTGSEPNNWQGCDYSKCGRTDKGVSAFGQVIGIRVRSNERKPKPRDDLLEEDEIILKNPSFDPVHDELSYPRILNRVLPEDIRVLAWCPTPPPDFSARFSCRERRYRYFFTQPAYTPRADSLGIRQWRDGSFRKEGWLDIPAMQEAANHFVGMHDFRNFCKHDPARQITNFERNITYCAIEEATSSTGMPSFVTSQQYSKAPVEDSKVYAFTVYGSAFLWHQVRHMAAILFHVGQGLEPASVVQDLLDIKRNPTKPLYEMADDAPLVLWDCIFPAEEKGSPKRMSEMKKDALNWVYVDGQSTEVIPSKESSKMPSNGRFGPHGLQEVLWAGWRQKKIDEVLAAALLDRVANQEADVVSTDFTPFEATAEIPEALLFGKLSTTVFNGGNTPRLKGRYTPIMDRERTEAVEILNARYVERKAVTAGIANIQDSSAQMDE